MNKALWVGVVLFCARSLLWAYDPSTADIAKVVGGRGGVCGGLGCGVDVGTGLDPFVREVVSLNGPWGYILDPQDFGAAEFYKDLPQDGVKLVQHDFDKAPTMNVPTDWNSADRSLLYYEGPMWLRRKFNCVAKPGRRVILRFGAVNSRANVWLDGQLLGSHEGGFTPFAFDVTALLTNATHSLVVRADATRQPEGVPCMAFDWWNYGGITRDVALLDLPEIYVAEGVLQCAKGRPAMLEGCVRISVPREGVAAGVKIPELGVDVEAKTDAKGVARFRIDAKPELWYPESPRFYAVTFAGGGDSFTDRIGFRTIETKGRKILLNGKPVFLKGVCFHDEKLGGGRSNKAEDILPQLKLAKELGCNFLRLAHYPHNEATVREAERQGFMVWSEIPVYWNIQWTNEATYANAERQLCDMVRRDMNRAGVVVWSLANETPYGAARDKFLSTLAKKARTLDTTRIISMAMEIGDVKGNVCTVTDTLNPYVDIVSFNQYIGWYWSNADEAARFVFKIPYDKPVVISEFGGGAVCGRHGAKTERWTEEYQAEIYRFNLGMLSRIDGLSGLTPWILNDFRSPRRPCPGIQDGFNRKGEKKLAFGVLQDFYANLSAPAKQQFFNDVKIPMRDGVNLAGDIYLPSNRTGKVGCWLTFSPYNATKPDKPQGVGRAEDWGVAAMNVDCRGLCHSEGVFDAFDPQLVDDADDLLNWIAAQPWSNGRIVMTGGSYPGNTQLAAMKSGNPHLVACAPSVITFDPYTINFQNGVLIPQFFKSWHSKFAGEKSWLRMSRHNARDDYWAVRTDLRNLRKSGGRAFYQAGWFDMLGISTFESFREMPEGSVLRIGPWSHGVDVFDDPEVNYKGIGGAVTEDAEIEFLRSALEGRESESKKWPGRILLFTMGRNAWRYEKEWPLDRTVYDVYDFTRGETRSFRHDPKSPVPMKGGRIIHAGGQYDQREIEKRADVLSYTGDELAKDLEITGNVSAKLLVSSTAACSDVTVKIVDVYPDGRAMNVLEGICRSEFKPGEKIAVDFFMDITSYVFLKGHRVRIDVAGSCAPHFDVNSNPATVTIHAGSSVVLPRIP